MHFVLVAHGNEPIPPTGWGAVEHLIWQYATALRDRGHEVTIVNEKKWKAIFQVLMVCTTKSVDAIHCHAEKPIVPLKFLLPHHLLISTTHNPINQRDLTKSEKKAVKRCHPAPFHLTLRQDISDLIQSLNPSAVCAVQPNGVNCSDFSTCKHGNGKAIYVGRIQERKRQNEVATLLDASNIECDFFGPDYQEVELNQSLKKMYKGEIDRQKLMENLCQYSVLILMSNSEGQPLVVAEALAAGIPVVVSKAASANLDLNQPFIHLVEDESTLGSVVQMAIQQRDNLSDQIRHYAEMNFDFEQLVDRYILQIQEWNQARK